MSGLLGERVHLKMLKLLCLIIVVLFCPCPTEGVGCLSSQSAVNLPLADGSVVSSFEVAAKSASAIFPALQFRCSGIVTHVSLSIRNRTELCNADLLAQDLISEYHVSLLVWERADSDGQYRFLGQHLLSVVAEEVERQCRQQQGSPVVVQFAVGNNSTSQLLVEPGQTVGFKHPFVYPISRMDLWPFQVAKPKLDIEFVEATPSATLLLYQGSQPAVNTIITAEKTPYNVAPRVGFSIEVSSVDASGSIVPVMTKDHIAILSATSAVAALLTANAVLLCAILICMAKKMQREYHTNWKSNAYTYPRFGLPNGQHSRRAPPPPPRPQMIIGPQEDYEYVSSSQPESSSSHLEESNTYI